jgi:hypothetical protein
VGEFARTSSGSSLERAVGYAGESDTPTDRDHDEASAGPTEPVQPLSNGERLHIVLDENRNADGLAQVAPERHVRPTQYVRVHHTDIGTLNHARHADANAKKSFFPRFGKSPHGGNEARHRIGRQRVVRLRARVDDLTIQTHVHQHKMVGGELHPDGPPGSADETEELPRPPTFRGLVFERLEKALLQEASRHLTNRWRTELELTSDGGARRRAALTKQSQHRHPSEVSTYDAVALHRPSFVWVAQKG